MALIIFLAIVAIVVTQLKKNVTNTATSKLFGVVRNIAYIGIFIAVIFSCVAQVGAGEAGVQVLFGSVQDGVLKSGLNFINPLVSVEKMDIRTQAYTMSSVRDEGQQQGDDAISTLSSDGLTLTLDLTVWYRLSEGDAPQVYRTIGTDYVEKIVRPAVRTAIRDVSVGFPATDIYSIKREDFINNVTKNLEKAFDGRGIILERVLLRNVELPEKVRAAIDEKIASEQRAQQMVYVLQKEKQEAERKRVEAQGISDYNRIVSQSITDQVLQLKGIEATLELGKSNNSKMVIMNGKNMPLIFGAGGF
ncbi:MAG: prohibitin family protein [Ignavibacteria bacterium]|nr:prohibitin family protein [Ignavibacteria bacterium]MCC7159586.1 prohibitin family protein [Ignavibacteria bacterium]